MESRSCVVPTRQDHGIRRGRRGAGAGEQRRDREAERAASRAIRARRLDASRVLLLPPTRTAPPSPRRRRTVGGGSQGGTRSRRGNADSGGAWRSHGAPAARSDHELWPASRRRVRIGRSIRNALELVRGRGRAVERQLGQDPPEHRRELERVGRAQGDQDAGRPGTRSSTKSRSGVSVYRQVFDADGSTAIARQVPREEGATRARASSSRSKVRVAGVTAGRRRPGRPSGPGGRSREAVERRLVHPDPDREAIRREERRVAARRTSVTCSWVIVSGRRGRGASRGRWSRRPRR